MKFSSFITIIILFFTACSSQENKKTDTQTISDPKPEDRLVDNTITFTDLQYKNAQLEVNTPQLMEVETEVQLQGQVTVAPQGKISLSFPLNGYISSIHVQPGTNVQKGQVLAMIQDIEFIQLQQDYLTAKTQFTLASQELERQKALNTEKASSDKVYQEAKANATSQQILMSALSQKLSIIGINAQKLSINNIVKTVNIYSPINGKISLLNINKGRYITASDILFEILDPNSLQLNLKVFEKDLQYIKPGLTVTAFSTDKNQLYKARIILINSNITADRAADVVCQFEGSTPLIVPGMFMNANIQTASKKALTVPEEAIVTWESKKYVFKELSAKKYEMIPITLGKSKDKFIEIESPQIDAQTKLVTQNSYTLLMALKNSNEEAE